MLETSILASEKGTKWQKRIIRCVLYLTRHPEVQAAAREEVEQVGLMVLMVMVIRVPLIVVMVLVIVMVMVLVMGIVLFCLLWC